MELDRILVGVDFSEPGRVALDAARGLALRTGAELVLAHVVKVPDWPDEVEWRWPGDTEGYDRKLAAHLETRRRLLEQLRDEIAAGGLRITHVQLDGAPGWSLVQAATELGADLAVVGSRGRGALSRLLVGSVAERVARRCRLPVLVARGTGSPPGTFQRVVVGTDFSEPAVLALAWARTMAAEEGLVDVVNCWKAPGWLDSGDTAGAREEPVVAHALEAQLTEHGKSWVVDQRGPQTSMGFHMVADTPLVGLLGWIARNHNDLLVVGSHGHQRDPRPHLGSVAAGILRHASCSVMVVR